MKRLLLLAAIFCFGLTRAATAASDLQWTFNADGLSAWSLVGVNSTSSTLLPATLVYDGALPVDAPTINLILGKRYQVTNQVFGLHYFEVLAMGASSLDDTVLLSETPGITGSMESDPGIGWTDSASGVVEFTVTQSLIDAMRAGGLSPGYRCAVHPDMMRGSFAIFGDGVKIANPIPAPIAKGTEVIELTTVTQGLTAPLGLLQTDVTTDTRSFVYDQVGKIYVLQGGSLLPTPFLDVSSRLVTLGVFGGPTGYDERGLIGFAFHPNFAANPKIYTWTSEPVGPAADFTVPDTSPFNCQSVLAEWQVSASDPNQIDPSTRRELLRVDKPQFNHNGGTIRFGPDGMLYMGLGDGGNGDDQGAGHDPATGNAQNTHVILGKIIRINVDGNNSANGHYGIPADNPDLGAGTVKEIWAYGVRNPYSFSFDRGTGQLFLGDVGQNDVEEVDIVHKGDDLGWHLKEGNFFFDPNTISGLDGFVTTVPPLPIPSSPPLVSPIANYDHGEGIAAVGGFVYRGSAFPSLVGHYIFGDLGVTTGRLFYLDAANRILEFNIGTGSRPLGAFIKGFGEDRSGEIYVCVGSSSTLGTNSGRVLKIVPISAVKPGDWNYNASVPSMSPQ